MKNIIRVSLIISSCLLLFSCTEHLELRDKYIEEINQEELSQSNFFIREGVTLELQINDPDFDYLDKVVLTNYFFNVYPGLRNAFNSEGPTNITIVVSPDAVEGEEPQNNTITWNSSLLMDHPEQIDLLSYQLALLLQDYETDVPNWLRDGIATYGRLNYGTNSDPGFTVPQFTEDQYFTDGGVISVRFFQWIMLNFNENFVAELNSEIQVSGYSEAIWSMLVLSDYTVEELWSLYARYPEINSRLDEPRDQTFKASISVSRDNDYGPDSGEGSPELIDNDINTKLYVSSYSTEFWMQQNFLEPVPVDRYTLTSGNDSPGRDPKNWTLEGSNDQENWVILDTEEDIFFDGRNTTKEFILAELPQENYQYYRLNITSNNGDSSFQLSEWRLYYVLDI